jgi:hypothetical protein
MVMESQKMNRWAAIVGRWDVQNGSIIYAGPEVQAEPNPYGILLSSGRMTGGVIRTSVSLGSVYEVDTHEASVAALEGNEAGRVLLGYRSPTSKYVTVGLGGYDQAYVISEFVPGVGWRRTEGTGSSSNLESGQQYQMEVYVDGQRLRLMVDGIKVLDHILDEPLVGDQVGLFAWGNNLISFGPLEIVTEAPTAFVAMQFSEPYTSLYDDVIKPVAEQMGFRAYAVSEIYRPGVILQDIIQGIAEARVVVAEITPPNPNVFYELGYAHALKKPTILLAERGKQLPFDISGYRVVFYDNTIRGKKDVEDNLRRHLIAILRD